MSIIEAEHGLDQRRATDEERSQRTTALLDQAAATSDPAVRREALDRVVELNMRVAESVARRYSRRGIPLEDLTQVAYLALVRAVGCYDHDRGEELLSYAVPTIQGEIRRHFRDQGWSVRPPREVQRAHSRILRSGDTRDRYDADSLAALAREVDESVEIVREALLAGGGYDTLSLDRPTSEDRAEGIDVDDPSADACHAAAEARVMLAPLVATMDECQQQILRWRFSDELSQRQIAERLGMTQVQVSRLLQRMLGQLRAHLGDAG